MVARLGGDEFGVLLRRVTAEEARLVADSLVSGVRERLRRSRAGAVAGIGLSIGVAGLGAGEVPGGDGLMSAADAAMYEAKARGGNRAHQSA